MSLPETPPIEAQPPSEATPAVLPEAAASPPAEANADDGQPVSSADAATPPEPVVADASAEGTPAAPEATAPAERGLSPAQTAQKLAELFPALFAGPPKPIKLRIQADIALRAPGLFTKRVMSFFLSRHTTTTPYLKALVAQTQRFDLDGQPAGEISEVHRAAAVEELARRKQIVDARRAAERAAQREQRGPDAAAPPGGQRPPRGEGRPHRPDRPNQQDRPDRPAPSGSAPSDQPRPPAGEAPGPPRGPGARPAEQGQRRPVHPQHPRHHGPSCQPGPDRGPGRHASGADGPHAARPAHAQARGPARAESRPDHTPTDPAQRERAFLLRAWESSSLTKANFCALKRMTEAQFDAVLEQARQERGAARGA